MIRPLSLLADRIGAIIATEIARQHEALTTALAHAQGDAQRWRENFYNERQTRNAEVAKAYASVVAAENERDELRADVLRLTTQLVAARAHLAEVEAAAKRAPRSRKGAAVISTPTPVTAPIHAADRAEVARQREPGDDDDKETPAPALASTSAADAFLEREDAKKRKARLADRATVAKVARATTCPACDAKPGAACSDIDGTHPERFGAARDKIARARLAIGTVCGICGAQKGAPCVGRDGAPVGGFHAERARALGQVVDGLAVES